MVNSICSILEIAENISLSFGGVGMGVFGLVVLVKTHKTNEKIQKINIEIEKEKDILDKMDIKNRTDDGNIKLKFNNFDKMEILKQRKKVNKLERKKKYLREKIAIYKIFKK
jgi:hypothetical protein